MQCSRQASWLKRLTVVCVAACAWPALAQTDYPNRPIRMIVPFVAGGAADLVARPLAKELGDRLGQPVVVESRAGANSTIGVQYVARSPADGYTILFGSDAGLSLAPNTQANLGYDVVRDFVPLAVVAYMTQIMVVNGASPINSMQDLARAAHEQNGKIPYASIGIGSLSHVSMESLDKRMGVSMIHVPYPGVAPAITDLLSGQVQVMLAAVAAPLPQIRAGKLKAIGFAGPERSASLPDVPTIAEQGFPGFVSRGWYAVLVPTGTPPAIVTKLRTTIDAITQRQEFQDKAVKANGYDVPHLTADEVPGFLAAETAKSKALVDPIRSQLR